MAKIKVLRPITVPAGYYCWQYKPPYEICEHLDNSGNYATCGIGFLDVRETPLGTLKSKECSALKPAKYLVDLVNDVFEKL